eukprot:15069215-Heterocapsa_arctica.AAC.1
MPAASTVQPRCGTSRAASSAWPPGVRAPVPCRGRPPKAPGPLTMNGTSAPAQAGAPMGRAATSARE